MQESLTLHHTLLEQEFLETADEQELLRSHQCTAQTYARLENAIAVLSDLKYNRSYIYHGKLADEIGLHQESEVDEIASIWEEDIFSKIHPDDLLNKHILELHFFQMMKKITLSERSDYHTHYRIRMRDKNGQYIGILHRMFYIASLGNGSVWLALCLYNRASDLEQDEGAYGHIIHSATGKIWTPQNEGNPDILSERELEILRFIHQGKISKEIARLLSISIHTVNRHRQNILEKLRVDNSLEACRFAERMQLFG